MLSYTNQSVNIALNILNQIWEKFLNIGKSSTQKQYQHINQYVKIQMMSFIKNSSQNILQYQSSLLKRIVQDSEPKNYKRLAFKIKKYKSLSHNQQGKLSLKSIKLSENNIATSALEAPNSQLYIQNCQNISVPIKNNFNLKRQTSMSKKNRKLSNRSSNFNRSICNQTNSQSSFKTIDSDQEIENVRKKKMVQQLMQLTGSFLRGRCNSKNFSKRLRLRTVNNDNQINNNLEQIHQGKQNNKDEQNQNLNHFNIKICGKINKQIIFRTKKEPTQVNQNLSPQKTIKTLSHVSISNNKLQKNKKLLLLNLQNNVLKIPQYQLQPGVKFRFQENSQNSEQLQKSMNEKKFLSLSKQSQNTNLVNQNNKNLQIKDNYIQFLKTKKQKRNFSSQISSKNKNQSLKQQDFFQNRITNKNIIKIQDKYLYYQLVQVQKQNIDNEQQTNKISQSTSQKLLDIWENKINFQEKLRKQQRINTQIRRKYSGLNFFNKRNSQKPSLQNMKPRLKL